MSFRDKPLKDRNWSDLLQALTIRMNDGTVYEVENTIGDITAWEKQYGRSFAAEQPRVSDILWVAWRALRRTKQIPGDDIDLVGWMERVADFAGEPVEWEDPTQPGQSTDSPSNSPASSGAPRPDGSPSSSETPE